MTKIHFMGIGGSGASAAAAIAKAQGYVVTGCDKNPFNEFTQNFDQKDLLEGHSKAHLSGKNIDLLVISPAIISLDPRNEELLTAQRENIPILTWQQFMGKYLEKDKFVIAVCGTHGKSTTTAMIGLLLEEAGFDPIVELGAIVPKWGSNYRIGESKYFVTEADEFNDNFLSSTPDITVVTAIEMDHPEYFKNFTSYQNSFKKFLGQTKETIIANLSDGGVREVLASQVDGEAGLQGQTRIIDYSQKLINFPLKVIGEHNRKNASAAYQAGLALGIDPETIKQSLMSYQGIGRRFEYIGNFQGAKVFSDFGHHPTEIKVTLEAARENFPDQKIIVIFQPHMFSRTFFLKKDFVEVLKNLPVDETIVMDIYPSREIDTGKIKSQDLVTLVQRKNVIYLNNLDQLFHKLRTKTKQNNIIVFIGAGDTDKWAKQLVEKNC